MEENIQIRTKLGQAAKRNFVFRMLFLGEFYPKAEVAEQQRIYLETQTVSDEKIAELLAKVEEDDEKENGEIRITEELAKELMDRVSKISDVLGDVDSVIEKASVGWDLKRIGKPELCILRVGVYEILWDEQIPDAVAVNEAVELAKKYGQEQSASFVNAILSKVVKKHGTDESV